MPIDPQLSSYATVRQLEYLEAYEELKSWRKVGERFGVGQAVAHRAYKAVKHKAALQGHSPEHDMTKTVPDGFKVKGVSTYYDEEGKVRGQWVKSTENAERREELIRQFVTELAEGIKGISPLIPAPTLADDDLLAVYPIGDHHHGMYADAEETGADYDCKISSTLLERAVGHLAALAPPASTALLINLGDFYHANDSTNETPGHGNRLDVDTRYGKVMHSGAMALVRSILLLLTKHASVIVWNMRGNHDPDAAFALAMAISFYFHNEPRVSVDIGSSLYKYHRFGRNLIGSHHGHGAKAGDLPLIMAEDRKADWGETEHRVWHCGHVHHKSAKEYVGATVETHRTLAASDAWHAGKGYRSKRDMNCIVYHRELGEVQRSRCDLEAVR